jgi:very-short-patch-repair endonuclease
MDTASMTSVSEIISSNLRTESPIESRLYTEMKKRGLKPQPQVKIGPYRVDYLLDTKYKKIVIEADGAEYHKDKERDRVRDEYLRSKDYTVLRFTGSEIYKNPLNCVCRIIEEISEVYTTKSWQDFLEEHLKTVAEPYPDQ